MFAPSNPIPNSRPTSAAGHQSYPHGAHYDLPRSPAPQDQRLQRSNSFSWKHELGLPPPPSEIDALGDSIDHALIPHARPASRARTVSPATRTPSRYDLEFGGLEDPAEHRDRTQDHMNMVTKHPKVKIDVVLSSNIFEAGGAISGKVELTCTTSQRLRIGEIAVELEAVEQLTSRDHAATQLFLYNRTMFQGENLPPSNAVLPAAPVNGYWTARKGRTSFPFTFRLPKSAPSCVTFAGNASLRYGLKATVQTWYNDDKMIVTARREAFVLERWSDQFHPRYREPVEVVGDTRLFMGGNGAVWLEAGVTEQLFWGGGQMLVRCGIKNNTKRHLSGIKVALTRRLIFPVGSPEGLHDSPDVVSLEPHITETVHDQIFKGREYEFGPNAESVCTVAVDIPRDLRTIRKTRLFEVRTFALVSLLLGSFAKDLTVEVPIYVAHTASIQQPAQRTLDNLRGPPLNALPPRSHSSMGHPHMPPNEYNQHPQHPHHHYQHHQQLPPAHSHHHPHHRHPAHLANPHLDSGMLEVERLAAERGWSPAPMFDSAGRAGPLSRPASTAPGMIQLPSQTQPFTLGPDGNLVWNPASNSWNASQFITPPAAGPTIQRPVSAAPEVFQNIAPPQPLPLAAGAPGDAAAWVAAQRAMSTSPGPNNMMHQGPVSPPQHVPVMSHGHIVGTQGAAEARSPNPDHGAFAGHLPQQTALPNVNHEVLPPMPEPQTIVGPNTGMQQYSAPPPQPQVNAFLSAPPPIAGLATIEEDGESQAGTVKTLPKLPTMGKTDTKGAKGNSVSRNNIEQFEAMAAAEEDEEAIKRQMIAMGMQPDEDAFRDTPSKTMNATSLQAPEAQAPASVGSPHRQAEASQASSTGTYRLKASDIFHSAPPSGAERSQDPETIRHSADRAREADRAVTGAEASHTREDRSGLARRPSATSLSRSASSHGVGLQALESNLMRSTTPKISSNPRATVTMANVGPAESSSSPLSSPALRQDESRRSRKDSALRAAALAREEAERRAAEQQAQAALERERQRQAEQERLAAAAEKDAAAKEAKRIRMEEQQRQERERIAEHARRQRELREQEEERQRAEADRIAKEQLLQRQKQEQEERERQERQAAEAAAAQRAELERARESRKAAESASAKAAAASRNTRTERIQAAISSAAGSIAPSLPSKAGRLDFSAPSKTSDLDRVALRKQAVTRIDGWLSNANSPKTSPINSPGTPSASVLSILRKDEAEESAQRKAQVPSLFPYRSTSQVANPLWEGQPARSQNIDGGMPKSRTMADLTSAKASTAAGKTSAEQDETIPQLSAELRALVDSSEIRPARKSGTALKEHPITRRLSALDSSDKANVVPLPTAPVSHLSSQAKRERHTSVPSGLQAAPISKTPAVVALPAWSSSANVHTGTEQRLSRNPEAREVGIPSRVEKTLMAADAEETQRGKEEAGYDARSARGGRGGRVTSVAQLWSKIAGDDDVGDSLAAPQSDSGPRSASPSSASTVKPKPRRSWNAAGGAPGLDFSKKAMASSSPTVGVTAIAATFGGASSSSKPEALKSFAAPQFLNTSVSTAVFAKVGDPTAATSPKRPLPKPVLQPGAVPAPQLVRPTAMRAAERPSRRISTQLLSTFEKDQNPAPASASDSTDSVTTVREMMSKVAVDSTILGALQGGGGDMSTLRCADGSEIKMSGRGTTKAIGETKLKSLRAVWGS